MTPAVSLGLPDGVRACLFDLDGVLTQTAVVHAKAWKEMFDTFLADRAQATHTPFVPFDGDADYDAFVDGKPRSDGTRAFLASRGIELPEGSDDDPPGAQTVRGLGNLKNRLVLRRIAEDGVELYPDSIAYVRAVRSAGLRTAVVSSSANTQEVLRVTGIESLFDVRVDAGVARERHLAGKPAPDTFLAAAAALGCQPGEAVVFEDALAGVEAGRAGGFALVIGIDRSAPGQSSALRAHGADVVVSALSELSELPR